MPLTEKETLLAGFDDAWSHDWESFESATKDLTETEALYQHPSYAMETQEEGWPKPGSIFWHLAHLEYWYHYYLDVLERMPETAPVDTSIKPVQAYDEALTRLRATRAELRAMIQSLPEDAFDRNAGTMRVGEFVRMIVRHDSWHSSQIRMARRLAKGA